MKLYLAVIGLQLIFQLGTYFVEGEAHRNHGNEHDALHEDVVDESRGKLHGGFNSRVVSKQLGEGQEPTHKQQQLENVGNRVPQTSLLMGQVERLQKQVQNMKIMNEKQEKQHLIATQKLQEEVKRLKQQQESLLSDVQEIKSLYDDRHKIIKPETMSLASINETVAFSAYNSYNWEIVFTPGQNIIFNVTRYNSGQYDLETSEFLCPVDGLYYFNVNVQFNLEETEEYKGRVYLRKELEELAAVRPRIDPATSGSSAEISSNSVITMCYAGERVYVQAIITSRIHGGARTNFNGFLLAT